MPLFKSSLDRVEQDIEKWMQKWNFFESVVILSGVSIL